MKKQSQNASSEAIKKAVLKGTALGITGLSLLATFTACNDTKTKPTPTPTPDPQPKPPIVVPVEKTVTINKIYNDYFSGTSFDADIQNAQNVLAERVFNDLTPQIANITYSESTKELTFDVNYVENNKAKSGSMTFVAPVIFQNIRGKQAKTLILEYADLATISEVNEDKVNETKLKIQNAIDDISEQITTGFAAVKTNSITVEKEQDPIPVETITFDELIADELGDYLGNIALLQQPSKKAIQQNMPNKTIFDDFKIAIENDKLIFYYNLTSSGLNEKDLDSATYKGSASEFEDLITISTNPQNLLNAYFTNSQQNNMAIEINSEEYRAILSTCQTIISNVNEQSDKLSALNYKNFTRDNLAVHNNELSQEEAMKFALKLGYNEDEVLSVYVGTSPNGNIFDADDYFDTGYMNWFIVSVLTQKDGKYQIEGRTIYVPHYTDSQQADYYRYFLEGEKNIRYITRNETTKALNGIICDFANEKTTAYATVADYNDYNVNLPESFLNYLPR